MRKGAALAHMQFFGCFKITQLNNSVQRNFFSFKLRWRIFLSFNPLSFARPTGHISLLLPIEFSAGCSEMALLCLYQSCADILNVMKMRK